MKTRKSQMIWHVYANGEYLGSVTAANRTQARQAAKGLARQKGRPPSEITISKW